MVGLENGVEKRKRDERQGFICFSFYVVEIEDGVFVHSGVAMGRVGFDLYNV